MMGLTPAELTLAAAIILAGLEVVTGTFVLLGFSLGALAVSATEALTGTFLLGRDTLIFTAVALIAAVALRRAFARPGDTTMAKGDVNDY